MPSPALDTARYALPRGPHLPGAGTKPDHASLAAMKRLCPRRTEAVSWADNLAYRYGWSLFEAGFYWEAHELWEPVWLSCRPNSRERSFLRALIQLSNARLKHRLGNARATGRLRREVEDLLGEAGVVSLFAAGPWMGVTRAYLDCAIQRMNA